MNLGIDIEDVFEIIPYSCEVIDAHFGDTCLCISASRVPQKIDPTDKFDIREWEMLPEYHNIFNCSDISASTMFVSTTYYTISVYIVYDTEYLRSNFAIRLDGDDDLKRSIIQDIISYVRHKKCGIKLPTLSLDEMVIQVWKSK